MERANFTKADLREIIVIDSYSSEYIVIDEDIFAVKGGPYLVGAIFNETIMPDGSINNPSI